MQRIRIDLKLLFVWLALLFSPLQTQAVFNTVVLDPGHGGWDKGGLRNVKIPEKKMTLLTAIAVRDLLQDAGLKVVMTRETDVYIPLSDRVEIANSHDNAIFVSIHYNADYGSSGNGIETYCARRSSKSVPLRDMIHRNLVRRTGARDRGVRRAGFYVLRHTDTVAVLVEGGFLSNPREAKKIADEDYRHLIAECIADGILDYRGSLGGSRPPRKKKPKEEKREEEKKTKQEKPKEATPVDEGKLPPAKKKADQSDAAKTEAKKKPRAPKPAETKKPAEVKKPAAVQTNATRGENKPASVEREQKNTNSVSGAASPVSPPKQIEEPKGTNIVSLAPDAKAPLNPELGPKTAVPNPEPPPPTQSPQAESRPTNQFRAPSIGLRD